MLKIFALTSCLLVVLVACHDDDGWHGWSKYKFEYGVKDPHTGDHKSQWEQSDGQHGLKGGYTLDEPDGTKRVVQYKADKWHGFQAIVKRIGHAIHPQNYGAPFVVRRGHQDQNPHQQQQHQDDSSYGQSFNGNGFWKLSGQQQNQGWADQQTSGTSNNLISNGNGNGWKQGGEQFATSYADQKSYHH